MIMFCVFCQTPVAKSMKDAAGDRLIAHQNCYEIDKLLEETIMEDDVW